MREVRSVDKSLRLVVVTPVGTLLDTTAESVTLPGKDGSFGVLYGHTEMLAALTEGELVYRSDGKAAKQKINGGLAKIKNNTVTVLTDEAVSRLPD